MKKKKADKITTKQVRKVRDWIPNPKGKGGFADHPELRSDGRWSKENSFTYWMNYFKNMSVKEFKTWEKDNPEDERTVASSLAYSRIAKSRENLWEFKEVADRTEGKATQPLDVTSNGESISNFNDEQIKRIADRIAERKGSHGNLSGTK